MAAEHASRMTICQCQIADLRRNVRMSAAVKAAANLGPRTVNGCMHSLEANRRAGAFCGATDRKISKEHVWPNWLRRVIEHGAGPSIGRSRTHRTRAGELISHDEWRERPIDWTVAAVCKPCNEGWMERIE